MNESESKVVGLTYPVKKYSILEEVIVDAGSPEALLKRLNGYLTAHGTNGQARTVLCELVKSTTKVPEKTKALVLNGQAVMKDGKPVLVSDENEAKYIARALAVKGIDIKSLQGQFIESVRAANNGQGLRCDVRKSAPGKPKTIDHKYILAAQAYITNKKVEKLNESCKKFLGRPIPPEAVKDTTALAWLIKEVSLAKEKAELDAI